MQIKEFSQKNSVTLFYSTVILLIIVIVLAITNSLDRSSMRANRQNFDNSQFQERGGARMDRNNVNTNNAPQGNIDNQTEPDQTQVE